MKKQVLIFAIVLFGLGANAQVGVSTASYESHSKWIYGGNAGCGFLGGDGFTVYATPSLGYKIGKGLVGGIEGKLSWQKSNYSRSSIWGVGPFLRYFIGRSFYASADFQRYFIKQKVKSTGTKFSHKESALNIGAGYLQPLGTNSYLKIGANYNVLYDKDTSVLESPFVPYIGIVFGL